MTIEKVLNSEKVMEQIGAEEGILIFLSMPSEVEGDLSKQMVNVAMSLTGEKLGSALSVAAAQNPIVHMKLASIVKFLQATLEMGEVVREELPEDERPGLKLVKKKGVEGKGW